MTAKKKVEVEPVDLEPVQLDPPDPAIARWQELADRDWKIRHDGDASKVLAFPRPEWSDEAADHIGGSPFNTAYRSEMVRIAAHGCSDARDINGLMSPAHVTVCAELWSSGTRKVYLNIARWKGGDKWVEAMVGLYPTEALELADVLRAAVDLIGGTDG